METTEWWVPASSEWASTDVARADRSLRSAYQNGLTSRTCEAWLVTAASDAAVPQ